MVPEFFLCRSSVELRSSPNSFLLRPDTLEPSFLRVVSWPSGAQSLPGDEALWAFRSRTYYAWASKPWPIWEPALEMVAWVPLPHLLPSLMGAEVTGVSPTSFPGRAQTWGICSWKYHLWDLILCVWFSLGCQLFGFFMKTLTVSSSVLWGQPQYIDQGRKLFLQRVS